MDYQKLYPGNTIHPTAILEGNIRMGTGNTIDAYAVLRGDIELGDYNYLGASVCMENRVVLGSHNRLYTHVSVGAAGEMGAKGDRLTEEGMVSIGHNVTLREFVCIHAPVYYSATMIDDGAYLMNKCYVAHDGYIGKNVMLSAGVLLGGRCRVEHHANVGMGAVVHQRRVIGQGSMVGMGSVVTRDILPYAKVAGNPARILGCNEKGAERVTSESHWLDEMILFFANRIDLEDDTHNPVKKEIIEFLKLYPDSLTKFR
jgi:UDP-N-acetylglucosamine acyltransferase